MVVMVEEESYERVAEDKMFEENVVEAIEDQN